MTKVPDIRVATNLPSHPKLRRLQRQFGEVAAWWLVQLWLTCRINRPTGDLKGWDALEVADASGLPMDQDPETWVNALLSARWIAGTPGRYQLRGWDDWNSWSTGQAQRSEQASRARYTGLLKKAGRWSEEMAELSAEELKAAYHGWKEKDQEQGDASTVSQRHVGEPSTPTPAPTPAPAPAPMVSKTVMSNSGESPDPDPAPPGMKPSEFLDRWNEIATQHGWPKAQKRDSRRQQVARWLSSRERRESAEAFLGVLERKGQPPWMTRGPLKLDTVLVPKHFPSILDESWWAGGRSTGPLGRGNPTKTVEESTREAYEAAKRLEAMSRGRS